MSVIYMHAEFARQVLYCHGLKTKRQDADYISFPENPGLLPLYVDEGMFSALFDNSWKEPHTTLERCSLYGEEVVSVVPVMCAIIRLYDPEWWPASDRRWGSKGGEYEMAGQCSAKFDALGITWRQPPK